jgi:regulator of cell morphogenesis and NO signaling
MQTLEEIHNPITIGELVAQDWRKAQIFKKYGIDYCCGGQRTVMEACKKKGFDSRLIEEELQRLGSEPTDYATNFGRWELDFLVDYIVNNHHQYVGEAIPLLNELALKVSSVHGSTHPELIEINRHTQAVIQELTQHMHKEEVVLFPYIKKLVQARKSNTSVEPPPFGTIANPIQMMEAEHTSAGDALRAIEELSNHFNPPADACMSYQVFYAKLNEFQKDLHQHVHLENNILFPKALKLEAEFLVG